MSTFTEIHVRLVDGSTGKVLSESDIPAGSLPETFTLGKTALKVSGQQWTVMQSDPPTREEYLQSGQLTLTLQVQAASAPAPAAPEAPAAPAPAVEEPAAPPAPATPPPPAAAAPAPAAAAIYPVPTLNDGMPETVRPGASEGSEFLITPDDWRQVELISTQYDRLIDAEIFDIEGIVRDHSVKMGDASRAYKKIFARSRIKTPITPAVPLTDISSTLPPNAWTYGALGFHTGDASEGADTVIPSSYGFDFGLCAIYGQTVNGAATVIGLKFGSGNYGDAAAIAAFLDWIMTGHSLVLVDWCWRRKFSGVGAINSYIKKKYDERQ